MHEWLIPVILAWVGVVVVVVREHRRIKRDP